MVSFLSVLTRLKTLFPIAMRQFCIDGGNIKVFIVEHPGHRRMVISCGLHNHTRLTAQAFEPPCQHTQFTVGVTYFKGWDNDLSKGTLITTVLLPLETSMQTEFMVLPPIQILQSEPIFFSLPIQSVVWRKLCGSTCSNRTLQQEDGWQSF